jgi:hypothetical protein
VAESVLAKHQPLILNRSRQRAPNLRALDRLISGICSLWINLNRLRRVDCVQAIHVVEFSSRIGQAKIPIVVTKNLIGLTNAELAKRAC